MFVRVINNIEKLKNAGIKIKVKIIANIKNKNELVEMEKYFYKKALIDFIILKSIISQTETLQQKNFNLIINLLKFLKNVLIL